MHLDIEGIPVLFPFDYVYPEQLAYMRELKYSIENRGHALIEMPCGTGKTVTILSFLIAYKKAHPASLEKIIYCTRTVPELTKVVEELRDLVQYYADNGQHLDLLSMSLSSRQNLCVNPEVMSCGGRIEVDTECRRRTATFARRNAKMSPGGENPSCSYFENLENSTLSAKLPRGIYNLEDIKEFGKEETLCPYFMAREAINLADIVIYSYNYLLDPKISSVVSKSLPRNSIVVFDEAHNIDSVCIKSLSVKITKRTIERAADGLEKLTARVDEFSMSKKEELEDEYDRLVRGLREARQNEDSGLGGPPVLPEDVLTTAIPGSIRKAPIFCKWVKRLLEYCGHRLRIQQAIQESPLSFLRDIEERVCIDRRSLRIAGERLQNLIITLEMVDLTGLKEVNDIINMAALAATYTEGFAILFEAIDERGIPDPRIQLACLDASLVMRPIFRKYQSVLITSGTLSPIEMYPRLLDFQPVVMTSLSLSMARGAICPMIVARGNDQVSLSSKFDEREDPSVLRNYGNLLVEICGVVPDGVVVFFTSYSYLENVVSMWNETGIIEGIQKNKIIFCESSDITETSQALSRYREACDEGRGAVLLSVARGKVSEGIDFSGHYGRAVLVLGIPFIFTQSRILRARLDFLRTKIQVREQEFLVFDAMRQTAQCLGRAIRAKSDYGIMLLADVRFGTPGKYTKLPKWLTDSLSQGSLSLSIEDSIALSKKFLRQMAQPFPRSAQLGISLLDAEQAEQYLRRIKNEAAFAKTI
ncbi:Oidioi.mRNA.OKI2018_I69.chr1.g3629.t1.cds [Oikopleura dioica]|uniref:DNA 5'-3' helicase n=1 Tax=Oikopleura dioica TaxID=34765 RepID=A0ABN7T1L3_OIKDI|nr:Oidioi.mRNA.OKI2018_I69.chr1.g3629.t1.cds [Oikopleura dioica]